METRLLERANMPFKTIPAAGVHGVSLVTLPGNIFRLVRGFLASLLILNEYKPDVMFFTGGYVAVPMAVAGLHIPSFLFVPDIEPAFALKTLAFFAEKIAVVAKESFRYFKHRERLVLTGYPTRADLSRWTRFNARQHFGLTSESPVLLVVGGSKGAHSINIAVLENLSSLLKRAQVIHITGELDWQTVESKANGLTGVQAGRYHAFPYLHEDMGAALAAADLVISRAGASTLGEYPMFGLPAILVPYPYAWQYQKVNADSLVNNGAALILEDGKLSEQLIPTIDDLFSQPQKLASMRIAVRKLSRPDAAAEIGRQLLALCGGRS